MQDDDAGRIAVLLFNTHLDTRRLCAFPKPGQVADPFHRAPRERNRRGHRMENQQLRLTEHGKSQRAIKGSLAGLFEIDGAEDTRKIAQCQIRKDLRPVAQLMPASTSCLL